MSRSFLLLLIVTFAVSMGVSYFFLKEKFEFDSSFIDEIVERQAKTEHNEQKDEFRRLYEPDITQPGDETNIRNNSSLAAAEDMVRETLRAYGVRLLDLYMDKEGVLYIDLGSELKKNFKGDAFEELNIIKRLYKSFEPSVPGFTALKILIDGDETETIGGHIDISGPIGKEIAEDI